MDKIVVCILEAGILLVKKMISKNIQYISVNIASQSPSWKELEHTKIGSCEESLMEIWHKGRRKKQ